MKRLGVIVTFLALAATAHADPFTLEVQESEEEKVFHDLSELSAHLSEIEADEDALEAASLEGEAYADPVALGVYARHEDRFGFRWPTHAPYRDEVEHWECPDDETFNPETQRCEIPEQTGEYNEYHCPEDGEYNDQTERCERELAEGTKETPVCPEDYELDEEEELCVTDIPEHEGTEWVCDHEDAWLEGEQCLLTEANWDAHELYCDGEDDELDGSDCQHPAEEEEQVSYYCDSDEDSLDGEQCWHLAEEVEIDERECENDDHHLVDDQCVAPTHSDEDYFLVASCELQGPGGGPGGTLGGSSSGDTSPAQNVGDWCPGAQEEVDDICGVHNVLTETHETWDGRTIRSHYCPLEGSSGCPSGYDYEDGTCVTEPVGEIVTELQCPSGYDLEGDSCFTEAEENTWTEYSCPDDYVLDDGTCVQTAQLDCPAGYTQEGEECVADAEEQTYTYTECPEGENESESGEQCLSDPEWEETDYAYCPDSHPHEMEEGEGCWDDPEIEVVEYTYCPEDYPEEDGSTCWADSGYHTTIEPHCPSGYDFDEAEDVCLAHGAEDSDYPALVPGEYEWSVTLETENGQSTQTRTVHYQPEGDETERTADTVHLPAIEQTMRTQDDEPAIQTPELQFAEHIGVNDYDLLAFLSPDAPTGIKLGDEEIAPGETVTLEENQELEAGQRFTYDATPTKAGKTGAAYLTLVPTAPNISPVHVPLELWTAEVEISSINDFEPTQVLDHLEITPSGTTAQRCPILGSGLIDNSELTAPLESPVCLFQWHWLPDEGYTVDWGTERVPAIQGHAVETGEQLIRFSVSMYDNDGELVTLQDEILELDVQDAHGEVGLGFSPELETITRHVEHVESEFRHAEGTRCRPTFDEDRAREDGFHGSGACYVELKEHPNGLDPSPEHRDPSLRGTPETSDSGEHPVEWKTWIYSDQGEPVLVEDGEHMVNVVDPMTPDIRVNPSSAHEGMALTTPGGGYGGAVHVDAAPAEVDFRKSHDGELTFQHVFTPRLGAQETDIGRPWDAQSRDLWETQTVEFEARYMDLWEVGASEDIEVVTVPPDGIRPRVEGDRMEVLEEETLEIDVAMDPPRGYEEWDASVMGDWEVQLITRGRDGETHTLSDWNRVDPATGEITLETEQHSEIENLTNVQARARLDSELDGYEREERSRSSVFVSVLPGGPLALDISTRRLQGTVPMRVAVSARMEDWSERSALGETRWEVRQDGGEWQTIEDEDEASQSRLFQRFEEPGQYDIRATSVNEYTGIEYQTEALNIHAYQVPDIELTGVSQAFTGAPVQIELDPYQQGIDRTEDPEPVNPDDLKIQWSTDDGETWVDGDTVWSSAREERQTMMLRARARYTDAPDHAWQEERQRVVWRDPRAPRVRVTGGRLAETGEEVEYTARVYPPYRGMDVPIEGEWQVPDGAEIDGKTVRYSPTEEDADRGHVEIGYEARLAEREEKVADDDHRTRVWHYTWPSWRLHTSTTASEAPATVDLRVRTRDDTYRIEGLDYDWSMPGETGEVDRPTDERKTVYLEEPGTYEFQVVVADDRGHESVMTEEIELTEPDPWEIDFSRRTSNEYEREPLTVSYLPTTSGGHVNDRVSRWHFYINGERVDSGRRGRVEDLPAGEHEIRMLGETALGEEIETTDTVTVAENEPPVCDDISATEFSYAIRLRADCHDPDGRVVRYYWKVNGEKYDSRTNRFSLTSDDFDALENVEVELRAKDDSGDRSEPLRWQH